jgi:hypothetical protein
MTNTKKTSILFYAAVLAVGLMGAASPAIAALGGEPRAVSPVASPTDSSKRTNSPSAATPAPSDSARYAEREKNAAQQEAFRGGGVSIYIGGSVLAVALLIILAILIL